MSYCIASKDKVLSAANVKVAKLNLRRVEYLSGGNVSKDMKIEAFSMATGKTTTHTVNPEPINTYIIEIDIEEKIIKDIIFLCEVSTGDISLSIEHAKLLFGDEL